MIRRHRRRWSSSIIAMMNGRGQRRFSSFCSGRRHDIVGLANKDWCQRVDGNMILRVLGIACCWIVVLACGGGAVAQSQVVGAPPEASNMRLVGYNDLQARSAYQPTIH